MIYKSVHINVKMDGWIVTFTIPISIAFVFSTIWFIQKIDSNEQDTQSEIINTDKINTKFKTLLAF